MKISLILKSLGSYSSFTVYKPKTGEGKGVGGQRSVGTQKACNDHAGDYVDIEVHSFHVSSPAKRENITNKATHYVRLTKEKSDKTREF